jgi:hypothetical protein
MSPFNMKGGEEDQSELHSSHCWGRCRHCKKFGISFLVALVVLFVLGKALAFSGVPPFSDFVTPKKSAWQAVFLTNNQVYFGHLKHYGRGDAVLENIFYLRVAEPLQQGATGQQPSLNLVKLGAELHGPQDTMYIPRDKIMFWENLQDTSQVVQAIKLFLGQTKK